MELSTKVKVVLNHLYGNQLIHGHYYKGNYCTEFLFQLKKATKTSIYTPTFSSLNQHIIQLLPAPFSTLQRLVSTKRSQLV